MDTKFDQILDFPCDFGYRVMGLAQDDLPQQIEAILDIHASNSYKRLPGVRTSSSGKYNSISYTVHVASKAQIELLYKELHAIDIVKYVL